MTAGPNSCCTAQRSCRALPLWEDKQRAVRLLDERGAFTLRKAVEDVADALGVSRFTVYNYLNSDD